jgi:hypothetical protein
MNTLYANALVFARETFKIRVKMQNSPLFQTRFNVSKPFARSEKTTDMHRKHAKAAFTAEPVGRFFRERRMAYERDQYASSAS